MFHKRDERRLKQAQLRFNGNEGRRRIRKARSRVYTGGCWREHDAKLTKRHASRRFDDRKSPTGINHKSRLMIFNELNYNDFHDFYRAKDVERPDAKGGAFAAYIWRSSWRR